MTVTVVGVDGTTLAPGGRHVLGKATLVLGSEQHLEAFAPSGVPTMGIAPLRSVITALYREYGDDRDAVLLVPGDPGFFGMVSSLRDNGIEANVLPAVSAVQRLAALTGRQWDSFAVVDATGGNLERALNVCRARRAVAVVTGPGAGPTEIAAGLAGWRRILVIAEELGSVRESLSTVDAASAAKRLWREPNVVFCFTENPAAQGDSWYLGGEPFPPSDGWALDDNEYAHRDGGVDSAPTRALILAKLAPRPGSLVWDIGTGAGAVAVECARLGAAVIAVEPDPGQYVRAMANAAKHEVDVRLVDGAAPDALAGLPAPDAVHVAGGGIPALTAAVASGAGRIVVLVTNLGNLSAYWKLLQDNKFTVSGCQVGMAGLDAGEAGGVRLGHARQQFLIWAVAS